MEEGFDRNSRRFKEFIIVKNPWVSYQKYRIRFYNIWIFIRHWKTNRFTYGYLTRKSLTLKELFYRVDFELNLTFSRLHHRKSSICGNIHGIYLFILVTDELKFWQKKSYRISILSTYISVGYLTNERILLQLRRSYFGGVKRWSFRSHHKIVLRLFITQSKTVSYGYLGLGQNT